ncbi:MAG: bifunctional 23S rRNA (guanine(2069)-N(7))-methyltransferase RlmK/23S rRNA (guanine(2445)-N(2))-methyltransferase RlmL [Coriobacteriales bacterium]|jgi:23S rRNA (guanine2445-N2)-methyltransferase / 23S rRNA (guanine2069-N7)-methyltransferase
MSAEGDARSAGQEEGGGLAPRGDAGGRRVAAGDARPLELSAPCPRNFEEALAGEFRRLGCSRVRPLTGSVSFSGDVACALRVCLWSRLASRVTLVLKRVDAGDADALYEGVRRIAWEDQVARGATIAVRVRGGNDALHDERFAAMRVKDAIVDRMRERTGARPDVDASRPDLLVTCAIHRDRATVGIDLAGESLVNRGYRVAQRGRAASTASAYLREDLASLLLEVADWPRRSARDDRAVLVDPLGTSPTLAVEAACVACDRAPGLLRDHWGFEGWQGFDEAAWSRELEAADDRFERGLSTGRRVVFASPDPGVRAELGQMAKRAGVADAIQVVAGGPSDVDLGQASVPGATICCVVPDAGTFGLTSDQPVRLAAVAALSRTPALAEAPIATLSSRDELGFALMAEPELVVRVMNGSYPAILSAYPSSGRVARMTAERQGSPVAETPDGAPGRGSAPEPDEGRHVPAGGAAQARMPGGARIELPGGGSMDVLVAGSDQFAARLSKVARLRARWARKQGVSCYRVYDSDLPDYAVTIDLYQGCSSTPGTWLVMSEYAAPREVDPQLARRRLSDAMAIAPRVMGVEPENVFLKVRHRDRGGSQYAGSDGRRGGRRALVEEGGLVFEVNFTDYLDTGLFLDNRLVRADIRSLARGERFLNLFAYTGSASVYAAAGGAYTTTTVDMSATYLAWARRNMEQNGFSGPSHEFVQADAMEWVAQQRHTPKRWGLIFVDPPTFSNSARMRSRGFDVQRDHAELLIGAAHLLTRDGQIVFTCNLRGFTPDVEALARAGIEISDVTAASIPEDFSRNARVHHCYRLRHAGS